ncbi:hypothetical protein EV122DRAFT_261980 [Schizophyllum commune]
MSQTREPAREQRPAWYRYSRRQVTSPVNSETTLPPPAENLQQIEEGHNDFDPTIGYLGPASEAGGQGDDSPSEKSRKRRFVGGFVRNMAGSLRQSLWPRWDQHPTHHQPQADWHQMPSTPHVPHAPNDQYPAQSPAQPSMRSVQSPAVERWEYSPNYDGAQSVYDPPIPHASVPPPVPPELATPYAGPGSDTHQSPPHETWDGTTAVHHEVRQEAPPISVHPYPMQQVEKPLSDSPAVPPRGGLSARIRAFFKELNSLPWIAPERITVDYVPARLRQPGQSTPAQGPLSWYGGPPDASRYTGFNNRYSAAFSSPSEPSTDHPREMSQAWAPPPALRTSPQPEAVPAPYYANVATPSPTANVVELGEPTVTSGWGTYPTGYFHQPPATERPQASTLSVPPFPVPGSATSASPQMTQQRPMPSISRPQATYAHVPMKGIPPPP